MRHGTRLATLFLALALVGCVAPVLAQEQAPISLRLSHWVARAHPFHESITTWSQSIAKASGGALSVEITGEETLGRPRDHYAMVRDGIVDLAFVNPALEADRFPLFSAGEMPLLVSDSGRGSRSFDRWYRAHAAREMPDVKYCLAFLFGPGTLHAMKPVATPDDVSGLKVRTANIWLARYVESLGAASVPGRIGDALSIIVTGRANAITLPWDSLFVFKLDTLLKHHVDILLYVTPFALLMNQAAFDRLSRDRRRIVNAHCAPDWAERIGSDFATSQLKGFARMAARPEHAVSRPTPVQRKLWLESAARIQRKWLESLGDSAKLAEDALTAYRSSLERDGALFK